MINNDPPKPPPGWYLDPQGSAHLRWFDGASWTEFLRPQTDQPTAPPGASGTPGTPIQPLPSAAVDLAKADAADLGGPGNVPVSETKAQAWQAALQHWHMAMTSLPERGTAKQGMFSSHPKGYAPSELTRRTITDIATGWGRPSWWLPEPATGGAVVGWASSPSFAVHLGADGVCDKVVTAGANELDLSWTMRKLGNVLGRPMANFEQALGPPSSRSVTAIGGSLLQWQRTGYHIALKFDADGYCLGITHQFAHRPIRT